MSVFRVASWNTAATNALAETLVAAAALFATDALAHRKLSVGGFLLLVAGWAVTHLVAAAWRRRPAGAGWGPAFLELVLPALWLFACNAGFKQSWSAPQMAHATGLVFCLWHLWRRVAAGTGEQVRLLLIGAAAVFVTAPYFTDLQLGGRDAQWYTSVFIDFLQQLRAGVFPVFLGQGEFSYNGSINLFRSAPLCLWIGGIGDWLTWQSLTPVAIRNLAVITAALGAGYGLYVALLWLVRGLAAPGADAPSTRWMATWCAVLYLLCPAMLQSLYFYELQMTWTALLALPWIFCGNVRTMQDPQGGGYGVLAGGLALAWLAHAPLAILSTVCTAVLQLGRFVMEPEAFARQWRPAARGALLFVLLSAFYFTGMSELPPVTGPGLGGTIGTVLGAGAVIAGALLALYQRRWIWSGASFLGIGLLALVGSVWLMWALIWLVLFGLLLAGLHRLDRMPQRPLMVLLAGASMVLAAAIAHPWAVARGYVPNEGMQKMLVEISTLRGALFQPMAAVKLGMIQPGYALWLLGGAALLAVPRLRSVALSLLASLIIFFLMVILRVPEASDFVVGYAPREFGDVVNFPMLYRVVPILSLLMIVTGFLVLRPIGNASAGVRRVLAGLFLLGAAWSVWDARPILERGWSLRKDRHTTGLMFSPDSHALGRYSYLLLTPPLHYMDGKQMPWMESRLLTPHYDLLVGPGQLARAAEAIQVKTHALTSREDEVYQQWLRFQPGWEVQPGETLLLRFEFAKDTNPHGWLILSSENGYQEHLLNTAVGGTGFGAGPIASDVLAVTNTGMRTEHYAMSMKTEAGNTLPRDGGIWGRVHISRYYPDQAPVRLESLVPYRARVAISEDGFLETPRQWIEGYRAWVDGQRVEPVRTKGGMLGVPVAAGTHTVVVEFVGSAGLWCGLVISAATVLVLVARRLWGDPGRRAALQQGIKSWIDANRT